MAEFYGGGAPLPSRKNPEAVASILENQCTREASRQAARRAMWKLAWYYLNGARNFTVFNTVTGEVQGHSVDKEGNLEFQSQDLVSQIDKVSGRLEATNVMPLIKRNSSAIEAIRDRSKGQLLLDNFVREDQLDIVKSQFAMTLTTLGCCGLESRVQAYDSLGISADYEMVHPFEVYPYPSHAFDYSKVTGIVRQRIVPKSYLEQVYGKRKINAEETKLDWWEQAYGQETREDSPGGWSSGGYAGTTSPELGNMLAGGGSPNLSNDNYTTAMVRVREVYLTDECGFVRRFVVTSGKSVLVDQDLPAGRATCPLSWARFMDNLNFYGFGMFDLLYGYVRQFELMVKSLFVNTRDIDRYGFVVLPQGAYNERAALREVGKGLKVMLFEPDPMNESFKPFVVQPYNAGDMPGRTAQFAKSLIRDLSPDRDLLAEKGRVDSNSGLEFLDQQIRDSTVKARRSMERAFSSGHKHVLIKLPEVLLTNPQPIKMLRLSVDLAGVIYDPKSDTVKFSEGMVSNLKDLSIGVREGNRSNEVVRKQELYQNLERQTVDRIGFILSAINQGLDIPIWMEAEKGAYESVVRNILVLFGDGETPGEIGVTPFTSAPDVQVRVLSAFMGSPVFANASTEVHDAFTEYLQTLKGWQGMVLPEGVPNPEDAALLGQQAQQGQPTQPFGGGGGPYRLAQGQ